MTASRTPCAAGTRSHASTEGAVASDPSDRMSSLLLLFRHTAGDHETEDEPHLGLSVSNMHSTPRHSRFLSGLRSRPTAPTTDGVTSRAASNRTLT